MMRAWRRTIVAIAVSGRRRSRLTVAGLDGPVVRPARPMAICRASCINRCSLPASARLKYEDLPTAPEALRTRLARYLSRRSAFKSGYKSEPTASRPFASRPSAG